MTNGVVGARLAAPKPATPKRPLHTHSPAGGTKISPTSTRHAADAPKLRPLNQPRPITVETGAGGVPKTIVISKHRRAVESALETWRIDDEWWRAHRVSRTYYHLLLQDGRTVDVYRDLARDRWFRQAYAG